MKPLTCGSSDFLDESRYFHGGDVVRLAERAGCSPEHLVDFSASLNPIGPPPWLGRELAACEGVAARYPDPSCSDLCLAACELYKVWPEQVIAGNGASELLFAVAAASARLGINRAVIPVPAYGDYERLAEMVGLQCSFVPMDEQTDFVLDFGRLAHELSVPALVFLCNPNNPTGRVEDGTRIASLAEDHPDSLFVVDESFADFVPVMDRLVRDRPDNLVTVLSLTKFYSVPGLRIGLGFGSPEMIGRMQRVLPSWSVNAVAQRVGARGLRDLPYQAETRARTRELREGLALRLGFLPGLKVFDSQANYLLCRTDRLGDTVDGLVERMLNEHMAIRPCKSFRGLDERYFRVAVRSRTDNDRLADAMEIFYGVARSPVVKKPAPKPAIMVQGASSNAGKSVIAAALCRIFLQDGFSVAPFKAQNMSLNSFVTADGKEMGRAQVTQAMACRLEPDVRMNPVLLKPGSDTGSQVIVNGRPVGNMNVAQYVDYKPRAFEQARRAYDQLAAEHDIMVIEGAGSPAEINLKHHDIVNMKIAEHAKAPVILVGDIDRGGVFASLVGTMELLTEEERDRVCGYVLNRFRGDESLLDPAITAMRSMTGKPVLGTVPYIRRLGLPEEDSVSFKAGEVFADAVGKDAETLDVAVVDLGHISNFNDVDPLMGEPDVSVRVVTSPLDLGEPDAVILPGSKNTVADMRVLKGAGMAAALRSLPESTTIVGICGGFQMLGVEIADPQRLETDAGTMDGFGLLPVRTTLAAEKTLTRTRGQHLHAAMDVHGYEIHHGVTEPLSESVAVSIMGPDGPLGFGLSTGRIWGTYLHGVFDDDAFRRWFVDSIRVKKGFDPVGRPLTSYGIEAAIDHLASVVRERLDMAAVYRAMGLGGDQLSLFG